MQATARKTSFITAEEYLASVKPSTKASISTVKYLPWPAPAGRITSSPAIFMQSFTPNLNIVPATSILATCA